MLLRRTFEFVHGCDVHTNFDILYRLRIDLLDRYYPERVITVTSSDPPYVTPAVKAMLRRKNRLMHAGRTDEAGAIAARICTIISRKSSKWLCKVDTRKCTKDAWTKVREVIRGSNNHASDRIDVLTPQMFNDHYAAISTDKNYRAPRPKLSASSKLCCIRKVDVFRMLDTLQPTATGLDSIPAWCCGSYLLRTTCSTV